MTPETLHKADPPVLRAAIVGAGPSGFYLAGSLLSNGFAVDLFDQLPTPYGLVRAGVAPDHPKIKSVARVFAKTAEHPAFRFFGGVELGVDVTRAELSARYHVLAYATGTSADNRLGIDGEDLPGSHPATEFVAWYNGHPHHAEREFDLGVQRAVVIGNGNVAIDVARMLVLGPEELATTDTADHALRSLAASQIREVVVVGRRGPAQAAFTPPELVELTELQRAGLELDPDEVELDPISADWLAGPQADTAARRNVELLQEYAARPGATRTHSIALRFLRSAVAIHGDAAVEGIRLAVNRIEAARDGTPRAVPTQQFEDLPCGLVLRAIGYRGRPMPDVPFDDRRNVIRNIAGRVTDPDGAPLRGEYVVGWIKRGPTGVIGTNKKDAADTMAAILEDRDAGRLGTPLYGDDPAGWLADRVPDAYAWDAWQRIDRHEVERGEPHGRPRVKIVSLDELAAASRSPGDLRQEVR
jgi:ferredoxin--NADP+ reductase